MVTHLPPDSLISAIRRPAGSFWVRDVVVAGHHDRKTGFLGRADQCAVSGFSPHLVSVVMVRGSASEGRVGGVESLFPRALTALVLVANVSLGMHQLRMYLVWLVRRFGQTRQQRTKFPRHMHDPQD